LTARNGFSSDDVDLAIENVIARRAFGGFAGTQPVSPFNTDETLVAELAALTEMDWPADESGDRITMRVMAAGPLAVAPAETATVAGRDRRSRSTAPRQRRLRWLGVGAVAAAAALVAGSIQLIGGSHGAASHVPGFTKPGHGSAPPKAPATLTAMTIVSKPGALGRVGVVSGGNAFLTCVTRVICYVDGSRGSARFMARSVDGGATWTEGGTLPAVTVAPDGDTEWNMQVSCVTPMRCVSAYETGMVETRDGFAHVRFQPIVGPSDVVFWVACPTTQHCVAAVDVGNNARKFVYSDDGGKSWAMATAPGIGYDYVTAMTCDASGSCIAALSGGDEENGTAAALSSSDGGRSWIMSATYSVGSEQQYWASCGDAQDCVIGGNWGAIPLAWIHAGAGKIGIRLRQVPQAAGTGISCATARDCFMVAGDTIEATRDGGHSWTAAPTAPAARGGGATLVDVSCPVPAGCIGLAQDNGLGWAVVSDLQRGR
jgi:hypothetical protein